MISSDNAYPTPIDTPPSICPSTFKGLMALPASVAGHHPKDFNLPGFGIDFHLGDLRRYA